MSMRHPAGIVVLVVAITAMAGVAAQDSQLWIHVQIEGQENENANIDLPVAALEAMLSMAPETVVSNGQVQVGAEQGISVTALREMWYQLRDTSDMNFLTFEEANQTLRVARVGNQIEVRVNGSNGNVQANLPVTIVDALLASEGDTLNISAAIAELKNLRGDIININEDSRQVRVWIDEVTEQ